MIDLEELNLSSFCCIDERNWQPSQNDGIENIIKTIPNKIAQLRNLKKINLYQCSVEDIKGVQYLKSLEYLNLDNNKLEDIGPVSDLTNIRSISISNNKVSDISPLKSLTQLRFLNLSRNRISDLLPLQNLTQVEDLDLWKNRISVISPLKNLIKLKTLSIADNSVTNIEDLKNLQNLQKLSIAENKVKNIDPILGLPFLEYLSLAGNEIECFTEGEFNSFPNLKKIYLFNNPIDNLPKENLGKDPFDNCIEGLLKMFDPAKIFISYSHKDKEYKDELLSHMASLRRMYKVKIWEDGQILAGQNWEPEIFEKLDEASLVLCLISKDFIDSEFCYSRELEKAIKAHNAKTKVVIPVIIKPCYWEKLNFAKIQCIPQRPVSIYENRDIGWTEVVKKIDESLNYVKKNKMQY